MSLSSDSAVLTMPVQPANTNGGNGFGFGNDGAWWIIILFLFAFCGGWGGNWGGNGNTGAGVVDGYVLTSDFANIERKMDGINNGMCDGFYQQAQLVNGVQQTVNNGFMSAEISRANQQAAFMQQLFAMQMQQQECCCENRSAIQGVNYNLATQSCETRNTVQATTETFTINKDRSFTFEVDKMDTDETKMQVAAASALARQQREKVFPEIDSYVYSVMAANAGIKPEAAALTAENIYTQIITANAQMDDAEVPASDRVLILTPTAYTLLKQSKATFDNQDIGAELRKKGVIAQLDGLNVVKIASNRLPEKFGFMIAHPVATVAPVKLAEYKIHLDPPFLSGSLVEGRIYYDAFVLENKAKAIYYQAIA